MDHLFVVHGYQGAEEDPHKLQLTDKLLQAVLAEAQVVCIGQPLLIAGDLNADPAVIPCLAQGISAGKFVDLALAYSLGACVKPDAVCKFIREGGVGARRDFMVGCLNALAAFRIGGSLTAEVSCPVAASWSGLLAGLTLLIGPPLRYHVLSRMPGIFLGINMGLYLVMLCLLLRMRFLGFVLMIFERSGAKNAEAGFFSAYCRAGPTYS